MKAHEPLLVEAVKRFLDDAMAPQPDNSATDDNNPENRGLEFLHHQIDEMFEQKATKFVHYTGICAAFTKTHNYRYITDTKFLEAFDKEMKAQGIPSGERREAMDIIPEMIKELKSDTTEWMESDFGFHPDLDDVIRMPNAE